MLSRDTQIVFFRSYSTNRRQYTLVNGIKSSSVYVKYGVPPGSILGPWLFQYPSIVPPEHWFSIRLNVKDLSEVFH